MSDLSSDYMIRIAWTRRSLAFDQATVMSFLVSEAWIDLLYSSMHRAAPPGYSSPGMKQLFTADAEMFVVLGEQCRSGIAAVATADGPTLPLDTAMTRLMTDPRVTFFLLPIPTGSKGIPRPPGAGEDEPQSKRARKKLARAKSAASLAASAGAAPPAAPKGKGKGKVVAAPGPPHMAGMWRIVDGVQVCYGYQNGTCTAVGIPDGGTCPSGLHKCCKPRCGGSHSLRVCTKP